MCPLGIRSRFSSRVLSRSGQQGTLRTCCSRRSSSASRACRWRRVPSKWCHSRTPGWPHACALFFKMKYGVITLSLFLSSFSFLLFLLLISSLSHISRRVNLAPSQRGEGSGRARVALCRALQRGADGGWIKGEGGGGDRGWMHSALHERDDK